MRNRCIADEVIRQIPRENLLSLVDYCATGLHYLASPIFLPDLNLPAKIAVFAVRSVSVESDLNIQVLEQEQVVTVVATPLPPNMRVQIWCRVDWIEIAHKLGWEPGFTPCMVAADIMRYLLRMIEGNERADAWQPQRDKRNTEFSPALQPITLNWRISELIKWVADFRVDTKADILLFHSEAKGYIDIFNEHPYPMFGMYCEHPVNNEIEVIPYILEGATPAAVAALQHWHDALQTADERRQAIPASTDTMPELSYSERKIKEAYDRIIEKGEFHPTDEAIANELPIGRKGEKLSRETVNRYRNKMRRRGVEV